MKEMPFEKIFSELEKCVAPQGDQQEQEIPLSVSANPLKGAFPLNKELFFRVRKNIGGIYCDKYWSSFTKNPDTSAHAWIGYVGAMTKHEDLKNSKASLKTINSIVYDNPEVLFGFQGIRRNDYYWTGVTVDNHWVRSYAEAKNKLFFCF